MEIAANRPISLDEASFLEEGAVNLYAIRVVNGKPEGARSLIAHLTGPALLCPMPFKDEYEIVAFTERPSVIKEIALEEVEYSHVQQWINTLALFYGPDGMTETDLSLDLTAAVTLEDGQTIASKRPATHEEKQNFAWIEVSGEVGFLGKSTLLLKGKSLFPLTYHGWVKSRGEASITATKEPKGWLPGLRAFNQMFYDYLLIRQEEEAAFQGEISRQRRLNEEKSVHQSLSQMVEVLNRHETKEESAGVDPIFQACKVVGESMEIDFHQPRDMLTTTDVSLHVGEICRTSEVRYRQVRLTKNWWTKDSGPLLGFYGEDAKPVALLAKRPGHYVMVDPATKERTRITLDMAEKLLPVGYCFYRSFPDDLTKGGEVLRFFFQHNRKEFIPFILYSILAALLALFPPIATSILFGRVIPEANISLFWQVAIGLVLAAISTSLFLFFRILSVVRIEGLFSSQIQSSFWDRLLKLPTQFFRRYSTGNLITRLIAVEQIRFLLSGQATRALFSGIFAFFYLIAMLIYAPILSLIAVGVILVILLLTVGIGFFYARIQKEVYEIQGKLNSFLVQIITAVGKLRTAGAEKNAFSQWAFAFAKSTKLQLAAQNINNILTVANYVLPYILYLFIFGFVIAHHDDYSVASFLAFNIALMPFYAAMANLSNTALQLVPVLPLWHRSRVILEEPLEEFVKDNRPGRLSGEISIDDLSFTYEGTELQVLNNVSMKINPTEFVAVVGPSGCGKSTLVRMLLGFEKPHSGGIFYDGEELSRLAVSDVRRQLGVVLQEEGIVAGSIFDNLVCGGVYSPGRIQTALEVSGFSTDLEELPMGIHTYLPMGGTTLSGGQKQRLLIARALLPNPRILIFDEATSALDNQNQKRVMDAIERLDITRIVIAHRLSTIRHADRIYVLEKGTVTQSGTFDQLAAEPGLFASMLKRQTD